MQPEHRSIGELAYRIWQDHGCPEGTAEQDWRDAEQQFRAVQGSAPEKPATAAPEKRRATTAESIDNTLKESFPASDPPASHIKDEPPANADAKWKAARVSRTGSAKPSAKPAG